MFCREVFSPTDGIKRQKTANDTCEGKNTQKRRRKSVKIFTRQK